MKKAITGSISEEHIKLLLETANKTLMYINKTQKRITRVEDKLRSIDKDIKSLKALLQEQAHDTQGQSASSIAV